jgi:hypothetical protein
MVTKKKRSIAYKKLSALTRPEFINRLTKRNYSPTVNSALIKRWEEQQHARKTKARITKRLNTSWLPVIEPLLRELAYVCVRLNQLNKASTQSTTTITSTITDKTRAHRIVYEDYYAVLQQARAVLRLHQRTSGKTPTELMVEKTKRPASTAPNVLPLGMSWVDWVDHETRERLIDAHIRLPTTTRPLEPLFRRDDYFRKKNTAQKTARINEWRTEINAMLTTIDSKPAGTYPMLERQCRLMQRAIDRLIDLPITRPVPKRIHGLLKQSDHEELSNNAIDLGLTNILPASVLDDYDYVDDEGNPMT